MISPLMVQIEQLTKQIETLIAINHKMQDKIYDLETHVASMQYDIKHNCKPNPCEVRLRD